MLARLLIVLPVLLLLASAWLFGSPSVHDKVNASVSAGKFYPEYSETLERLATSFVAGTIFDARLNTREPPRQDRLNLYVVSPEAIGLSALTCNCGYIGYNIILCDKSFLDSFSRTLDFKSTDPGVRDDLTMVDALFNKWLASWLIGHEIGHAVLHDRSREFSKQFAARRAASLAQEDEADMFFGQRVPPAERDKAVFVLNNFAFQMISLTYIPTAQSEGKALIKPSADGIHAPWLLRSLALARSLSEAKTEAGSGDDFYGSLSTKIRITKQGRDIGSLCDAQSLRERTNQVQRRNRPR